MSVISKYPIQLRNLSQDLKIPSVAYSGWPPPSTNIHSNDVSSMKNIQSSDPTPLLIDEIDHRVRSIGNNYFERLRCVTQDRHISHTTTANNSTPTESLLDDTLEDLIRSIRPSTTWDFDDTKNNQSQVKLLRQIYLDSKLIKQKECGKNTQQYFDNYAYTITTPNGNIFFDFSKQSINYTIYIQLMQLVRLSNLDKIIQKIFHKSGEYHHVDYRENRRHQLEIDQENYQYPLKSPDLDKINFYLTMAKAVHYRTSGRCFVLNGIDISSRFQYDRKIIQETCHRFHSDINIDANTKQKENNDSSHTATDCADHSTNTRQIVHRILVLCTDRMKQIYRLFESLFKSYISPNMSIIYITFDQIKPVLTKYEQLSDETFLKDTPASLGFQSTVLSPSINTEKDVNDNTKVINENVTAVASEEHLLNKIDLFDEEYLLDCFRTSSLVLIFMKHLDESYLTTFIQWYTEVIHDSDQPFISNWNTVIEYCWLITSDYQRAETIFNIPKTNLFLWPTEVHDFDHISIIISSILCLPIALSINYQIYSMFINGMSIVDKHCQETTIDQNICIQMALLRIWSRICERRPTAIIIDDGDDLQYFGEYIEALCAEYDDVHQCKMVEKYMSIHGISSATMFLQQNFDHFSYDLIAISRTSFDENEKTLREDKISHPYSLILLDQFTPLTLGVVMGVYQLSIFFESIIRDQPNIASDLNEFHSK